MSIRKRNWTNSKEEPKSAWQVDYTDNAGRRRAKQFAKKKDAEAWLTSAAWQVSQGIHTADSQSITVAEAGENWIEAARINGRERSTLHGYDNLLRLHISPIIGAIKLSKLTRPTVERFRDDLLKSRSPSVTRKAIQALSSLLNNAMRRGLIAQNVASGTRLPQLKRRKSEIEIPTADELRAIFDNSSTNEKPLILTLIFTGIRVSELRGLRWSDVDLTNGVLHVRRRVDQWSTIGLLKSDAAYRSIPIPPLLVKSLTTWKLKAPISKQGFVFPSTKGTAMGYHNLLRRVLFPIQIKAGLTKPAYDRYGKPKNDSDGNSILNGKYGFHAFRHAAASNWISQNIDLKRLQVWMGHESVQITLDTYGHLIADTDKDAEIALAAETKLFG